MEKHEHAIHGKCMVAGNTGKRESTHEHRPYTKYMTSATIILIARVRTSTCT